MVRKRDILEIVSHIIVNKWESASEGGFIEGWERLLPEGQLGGVRGKQGSGVNQKTVQARKTNMTAKSPCWERG